MPRGEVRGYEMMKTKTSRRRHAAEVAVNLVARNLLQGLRQLDWEKWKKSYAKNPKNLEKVVGILARLSREVLARERFREELRAEYEDKRPPKKAELSDLTGVRL
jgi:hypothetical protein